MFAAARRIAKLFLLTAVAVIFVAFAVDNREWVALNFFPLPYRADVPAFILILFCFMLGTITGGLTVACRLSLAKRQLKAERQHVAALQNEVKSLQTEQQSRLPALSPK